jgi:hypothetical protein
MVFTIKKLKRREKKQKPEHLKNYRAFEKL